VGMNQQPKAQPRSRPFPLGCGNHLLLRDGEAVTLTTKAFDALLALVERLGELTGEGGITDDGLARYVRGMITAVSG
jgi:DNA-binding winged helix-turn-helix (wHTH) protein